MPITSCSYQKGCIYKIACKDPSITDCYVGSTTNFTKRKSKHKHYCKNPNTKKYNFKVYKFIRENGDWDNWEMILLEDFPCENNNQLKKRERDYLEELEASLNSICPYLTEEEAKYYKKTYQHEYSKIYRENNRDKLRLYKKEWRQKQKDKKDLEKVEAELINEMIDQNFEN